MALAVAAAVAVAEAMALAFRLVLMLWLFIIYWPLKSAIIKQMLLLLMVEDAPHALCSCR